MPAATRAHLQHLQIRLGRKLPCAGLEGRAAYAATYRQQPALVTIRLTDDLSAIARHQTEQDLYRLAAAGHCPLPLAALHHTDEHITIAARPKPPPPQRTRHPRELSEQAVIGLLDHLDWLYAWTPSAVDGQPKIDDGSADDDETAEYLQAGLLRYGSQAAIRTFLRPQRLRTELGNVDPTRFRFDGPQLTGVDGPFDVALRPAGHDWAAMQLRWGLDRPWLGRELADRAYRANLSGAYAAQLMLAACRQWVRDTAASNRRPWRHAQLDTAREHLRRVYEESW